MKYHKHLLVLDLVAKPSLFCLYSVILDCGYLHNYTESDVIYGTEVKLGYFPSQGVLDNPEKYVRKWYKDSTLLDPNNDPYLKTSSEPNNEFLLTLTDVGSFSSGLYRVRCTENRTDGDKFTNTVHINVIGNVGFLYPWCIWLLLFKLIQCFIDCHYKLNNKK